MRLKFTSEKRFKNTLPLVLASLLLFSPLPLQTNLQFTKENTTEEKTTPVLKVSPPRLIVTDLNSPLPLVNITVENVENLFAWQIKLHFNPKILNISEQEVFYPENHVFSNKKFIEVPPKISQEGSYIKFGASLLGEESFTGSGILCRMKFTAISTGLSQLNFSTPIGIEKGTFLLDSDLNIIIIEIVDSKPNSILTLKVEKTSIQKGLTISLTGTLTPKRRDAQINIYYKTEGILGWAKIASVKTNLEGKFHYQWKPPISGTYTLFAEWKGDQKTNPSISQTSTVIVEEPMQSILLLRLALGMLLLTLGTSIALLLKHEKQRIKYGRQENAILKLK
jgi:hypothetical protein